MERDSFSNVRRAGNQRLGNESDLFTLFVDNIPLARNLSWLETLFSNYGIVKGSFIPAKRSKRGSKFGFVRFDCSVSAAVAISRANGLEVEGYFLFVKKARFDLVNKRRSNTVDSSKPIEDSRQKNMDLRVEVGKSYAQALKGGVKHGTMNNKVEGLMELVVDGMSYSIRVEEEESFRILASSTSLIDLEMAVDNKDIDLDQKYNDEKSRNVDLVASNDVGDALSNMDCPDTIPANHLKDFGDGSRLIEEQIHESMNSSNVAQTKSKEGNQDILKIGIVEGNISSKGTTSVIPETQVDGCTNALGLEGVKITDSSGDKVLNEEDDLESGNSLEDLDLNHIVSSDPIEDNHSPIQAAVKGIKGKKRRKNIDEVLGRIRRSRIEVENDDDDDGEEESEEEEEDMGNKPSSKKPRKSH
ncbi:hypothetical protein Vadar_032983 [Vaccinium darrowii]|uniref:Uncharacterized protein n=1 Tax=Vaccinium darrowii TaxID=229202 RepID=A0ACB7Y4Z6_9ERIC|nr:hypothetical protein Vadar_032983 [Vaccinium darrowii]